MRRRRLLLGGGWLGVAFLVVAALGLLLRAWHWGAL